MVEIKDKHGNVIEDGIPFRYKYSASMPAIQSVTYSKGDNRYMYCMDGFETVLSHFWYAPIDEELSEIIGESEEIVKSIQEKIEKESK